MNRSTIQACIDHYKRQLAKSSAGAGPPVTSSAGTNINAGGANKNTSDADINTSSADIAAANVPTAGASDLPPCQTCIKYCQLLSDVLLDTLKFHDTISSMSSSTSNFLNLGIHKASALTYFIKPLS